MNDKTIIDVFVEGAKKGWNMGVNNIIPNVLMAYVCILILQVTGLLTLLGNLFTPVMAIFGLPGQSVMVLFSAMMSMGGAVGVAHGLYTNGILNGTHITILIPAIYLLGSKIQYFGRLLGTVGIPAKYYPGLLAISVINAAVAMLLMRLIA
ncbi:YjiG family protein [Anaerospora hongkongensis]|uniref:YjiG family protein n=1 Tax=Anaerospora hongkongensis TaxID=244830 RepID=UPI002FDAC3E6